MSKKPLPPEKGGHKYRDSKEICGDRSFCDYGCGCAWGESRADVSMRFPGTDPKGRCPKNPINQPAGKAPKSA